MARRSGTVSTTKGGSLSRHSVIRLAGQHPRHAVVLEVWRALPAGDFRKRSTDDLAGAEPHHHAVLPPLQAFYRRDAETRGKQTVPGARAAAALHVAQNGDAEIEAGVHAVELLLQDIGAELRAFRDDDDGVGLAAGVGAAHRFGDFLRARLLLGDQDHFSAADDARHEREVAAVAPHGFDDECTLVRRSGVAQLVDRIEDSVERGVDADRNIGAVDVVVDGCRDADHRETELLQRRRAAHGAVAADRDQRFYALRLESAQGLLLHLDPGEFRKARRLQDGAAALDDAADVARAEFRDLPSREALVSAPDPEGAHAQRERGAHHRAHRGIHSRRIAARGQYRQGLHAHPAYFPMYRFTASASGSMTSKRCGSDSRFSKPFGISGSRPSASRMVAANLAGSAVSRHTSGTPGSRCSSPTFTPSAVCGSMVTPYFA